MSRLRLTLLGGFEARNDSGLSLSIPRKKAQMLLAYLAMHPKRTHLRDKLATLLWDDASTKRARQSLRQTLFALRQALPSNPILLEGDSVAFATEAMTVDVREFEEVARSDDPDRLEQAVTLYQGGLLEAISPGSAQFEEWLRAERERLHELALEAFAKLLAHQMKLGATEPAIQTALQLLSLDPLQEVTHRALMRLYTSQGRRAAALRQYQVCVDVLQRELGVEPEEATKQVYRELLPRPLPRGAVHLAADPQRLPQRRRRRSRSHHRSRRITTPLIGRDAEVDRLNQVLGKACASDGQVVAVLGEAGIGKTRLITALREATTRRGARALIGQSYETERLLPFGPWVHAIREAGIVESRALEGLGAGWLAELSYLLPELRPPEWPVPSEPTEALRLFDAMTELVKSLASRQPLVLVLEDLHWADEMSVRLFSFLGHRLGGHRILLVGTVRDEELGGSSPARRMLAELSQNGRLVRLGLAPLSREHTRVLVRSLAEGRSADESSLTRLEERIWTLSEGNPFVIVESLREVLDTARRPNLPGLPALPEKVQELIIGRFERLNEAGQNLVATAAVIGRDFEFRLLQRAADAGEAEAASAVESLVRTQILHSVGDRFDFTHERFREVAYGRLLAMRRRMLHARVATALEEVYAASDATEMVQRDCLSEHIERIAYHAVRGELLEKAVPYLRQVGANAFARSAYRESASAFQQALEAVGHLPETSQTLEQTIDLHFDLRHSLFPLGELDQALAHLREAERLATRLGDQRRLAMSLTLLGNLAMLTGHSAEAQTLARGALDIADSLGDFRLQARATYTLGVVSANAGQYRQAEESLRTVVGWLDGQPRENFGLPGLPVVTARGFLAGALGEQGEFAEGITIGQEAIRLGEVLDNPYGLIWACFCLALAYCARGDLGPAIALLERAADLCRVRHVVLFAPRVAGALGHARALSGRIEEGVVLVEQALRAPESAAMGGYYALVLAQHAEVCGLAGRAEEALESAQRAAEVARTRGLRGNEAYALRLLGDFASHRGSLAAAHEHYWRALALAKELEMRPLVARCHLGLGVLCRHTGDAGARQHLTTAVGELSRMGMQTWREQAEAELATLG